MEPKRQLSLPFCRRSP